MKMLIQITFNNGLGNLYCGVVDVLHYVKQHKELGYDAELIFASNGSSGGNKYIDSVTIDEIFDINDFVIFDNVRNIKHSINDKSFEGYTYHSTQYGPDYPGAHWWDVFYDVLPDVEIPKPAHNMERLLTNEQVPEFLPKLNKIVYDKVELVLSKKQIDGVIQVRHLDYHINPSDDFKNLVDNLHKRVSSSKLTYYLTSNNQFLIDKLSDLPNIVLYNYNNLDILPNDHNYFMTHSHINRDILLERLYDNLCEMVLLENFNKIYHYTSFSWISTFLFYSRAINPKQSIIDIKHDLTLIE